ncbi:hypothetical protein [Streptomyces sp. NPDC056492]|uniref:hypothetical protein n=1 Tax=unclassified Streptomyces TaxID=2593676 RepID=UPI0036B18F13
MAELLGVSAATYQGWEAGRRPISNMRGADLLLSAPSWGAASALRMGTYPGHRAHDRVGGQRIPATGPPPPTRTATPRSRRFGSATDPCGTDRTLHAPA